MAADRDPALLNRMIWSDGTLAIGHFATAGETYGESRMPPGRRVVVGDGDIELALLDEDDAEFRIRDHDRDPAEPVGLRPPGGTRSYPPGFSVDLEGYRITWHDRVDDELQVTLLGPDDEPVPAGD